ncbi:Spo0E family sporulation regulatory protein-aspartic acid phosphatase [Sediminibacillus dalangtanensis]|uniref:Spo0E family sporulation regulatory protein-aspartic acid phosphatase n=1 Tax=Sediminibacillus dalangtanensis TaxID=2729421 RepID=A0ABX7VSU5_9BACI|nr:Spo0E family sporulation regulatory protein-aspartic acid phosphatase [Sediminibacillus dalangtanensis]QTM99578.1 Spo0E family sporulation regulatory protein-aspartic acid phosphatase [Sediminibacillus dalangtanensis]
MQIKELEKEIRFLQIRLYQVKDTDNYSNGAILQLNQKLDKIILYYQKIIRNMEK